MILKKPYAFFIRMFKPIHILVAFLITYLIYNQNRILIYLNNYMQSNNIGLNLNNSIFFIPFIIIIICISVFLVMAKKNKPLKFYIVSILLFLGIVILNIYISRYINKMVDSVVPISRVKLVRDLTTINIITEVIMFVLYVIRGLGLNLKKFDFSSDLLKLDIDESDKEEIEVSINLDSDLQRRRRKGEFRNLKYIYLESKGFYNIIFACIFIFIIFTGYLIYKSINDVEKQSYVFNTYDFSFKVDQAYIVNKSFKGNDIDNLIVISTDMKSTSLKSVDVLGFSLIIGDTIFKPITKYKDSLIDLGVIYKENELTEDFTNYLIVFDIPEKYLDEKMILKYSNNSSSVKIRIKPKALKTKDESLSYSLGDEVDLTNYLGDIKFKITEFDVQNSYLINYEYCHKDYCLPSIEYLKPTLDERFDKTIIRLKVEFNNNSKINVSSFYDFFTRFGMLLYNEKYQKNKFENIVSKKSNTGYIYIGVNSEVLNSNNVRLLFSIRGTSIEYQLRGES